MYCPTGLHFSTKHWNPEYNDSLIINVYNNTKQNFYALVINVNNTVTLQHHHRSGISNLKSEETRCIIPSGLWMDYRLIVASNEIILQCELDKARVFQGSLDEQDFDAAYLTFESLNDKGLNFPDNECIFENISSGYSATLFPIDFRLKYKKKELKLHFKGTGSADVTLYSLPSNVVD